MKRHNYFINLVFILLSNNFMILSGQNDNNTFGYAVTNVSIIDVENGGLLKNRTIVVKEGLINEITPESNTKNLSGLKIIDGKDLFIIPGLFDSHVHYLDPESFGAMFISFGVLFVREMGNVTEVAINQRNLLNSSQLFGPEMITTGAILDGNSPFIPDISLVCNTPEEGRAKVHTQLESGVDEVKTYSKLEKDVFLAIVDECKKNGIKVVGHIPEGVLLEDAAKYGLNSSEHTFGFGNVIAKTLNKSPRLQVGGMGNDQEFFLQYPQVNKEILQVELKNISSYGMAICPTLIVTKCMISLDEIYNRNYPLLNYISPLTWKIWKLWQSQKENIIFFRQIYPYYKSFLKDLYDAEFTLLIGTDLSVAGVIPGYSVHEEMAIWQEAGIPPFDILRSATIIPAKFMGVEKSLGSIEEGKKASFVLLSENPLTDIKNTQKIEGVFLHGTFFSRQEIDSIKFKINTANELLKR
jgi:imidazolonepropionase-like amidohydrolase